MKKLLALALALALLLSAVTVFVSAEDEISEPSSYLVLTNAEIGNTPYISYTISGEKLTGPVDIEALVCFGEDCEAPEGSVYLNIYPWDGEGNLLHWTDYAKNSTVELGKWTVVKLENWDCSKNGVAPSYATLTTGFYQAKGTVKVAYIKASVAGEVIFEVDYAEGFDLSAASDSVDITDDTKGTKWDYVEYHEGEYTNLAAGKSYTVSGLKLRGDAWDDSKAGKLTDKVKGSGEPASDVYLGIKCLNPEEEVPNIVIDVVLDLGEVKDFDKVSTDVIFGKWGIDAPLGIEVAVSEDGETYSEPVTAVSEDLEGFVNGWTGRLFTVSGKFSGRYVKVSYVKTYNVGADNHIWPSELEVFGYGIPAEDIPEESEEVIPEPESYLTIVNDGSLATAPGLTFSVPADLAEGKDITVESLVYFGDDCEGTVYLNLYPYDDEGTLLRWSDYAKASVTGTGAWKKVGLEDWDAKKDDKVPVKFNLGIGFWQATGTVKVAYIKVIVDGETVWSVDFADGLDLESEYIANNANITAETEGTVWYITGGKTSEETSEAEEAAPVTEMIFDLDGEAIVAKATFTAANPEGLENVHFYGSTDGKTFYDINAGAAVTVTDGVAVLDLNMAGEKHRGFIKLNYIKVAGEPDVDGELVVEEAELADGQEARDPAGPYTADGLNESGYGIVIFSNEDVPDGFGVNDKGVFTSNDKALNLNGAIITIAEQQEDGSYLILWNDCNGWTAETGSTHTNTPAGVEGIEYRDDKVFLSDNQVALFIISSGAYETAGDGEFATAKWVLRGLKAGDSFIFNEAYYDNQGNTFPATIVFAVEPDEEPVAPVEESEEESQAAGDESQTEDESQGTAPVEESQDAPAEESKGTTHTGDAGIIALAVVSVLALGGAVVVKKSK